MTYIIKYGVYYGNNKYESHETKVKNCLSELHAKIKLERWLEKKYENFTKLVVYKSEEDFISKFGDIFNWRNTL